MIMVVYHRQVAEENREAFIEAWRGATLTIRGTTNGALGSICPSRQETRSSIMKIARWTDYAKWNSFIESAQNGRMRELHKLAKLTETVVCKQLGDFLSTEELAK